MYRLEWVLILLLFVRPNLYYILGSKYVESIFVCCILDISGFGIVEYYVRSESGSMGDQAYYIAWLTKYF